jgi:hypothetical protein
LKRQVYLKILRFLQENELWFGSLVGGGSVEHSPTLFDCLDSVKLKMLAINDDSDALILFLCHENEHTEIIELAKEAEINLYFEHM